MSKNNLLDVYLYIDTNLGETHLLQKCLELFLITQTEYKINFIKNVDYSINKDNDIIENGIRYFKHSYNSLKLKGTNEVWCFYITNGHINTMNVNDVTLILLNKDLSKNECFYTINKNNIHIDKNMDKNIKLQIVSLFKMCIQQIVMTDKIIKYK
jgi:hypothetical protein